MRVGDLDVVVVVVFVSEMVHGAALPSTQLIEACIGCDAICPCAETAATIELGESANDCDHGLLRCVGSVGIVTDDATTHGVYAVVVATKQHIKAGSITALSGCYERVVVNVCGNALMVATMPHPVRPSDE